MRILTLFLILVTGGQLQAQNPVGIWHGTLDLGKVNLRLIFHIDKKGDGFTATMDSPDQGAAGIPIGSVAFNGGILELEAPALGVRYKGKLEADTTLSGTFYQSGMEIPLYLVKQGNTAAAAEETRPQEPHPPFPYRVDEVTFANPEAGITLAGTLTRPQSGGPFATVVLVSGSGPQNRDEELFGHKPFLVIADYLTRQGYAVLRYDDRGVGASTGDFAAATTADFATDAAAAVTFLQTTANIDPSRIGILGHSEGGMIAPIVASVHPEIAFLILLAAPGIPLDSLLVMQNWMLGEASGVPAEQLEASAKLNKTLYALAAGPAETAVLEKEIRKLLLPVYQSAINRGAITEAAAMEAITQQTASLTSPWMRYFLGFNPGRYLARVTCPVLALNGDRDLQVSAKENLAGIETALRDSGNDDVTIETLPGLNHLFQESETGLPAEYGRISQTFSPIALEEILKWL
ncbi:alpha/beta hydrolase family protein [Parapedobacter indicus]|uniref:Serine aminopeptidase S33 domain-containing protein n=1 Tax=Parapedobacter indicus TaxID=1477437 RepID=A0A1I3CVK9_9SPHI|nr:alpha/beta hydrolase [Parapedobacter indicus]PPL04417.1 hypothetical protein CLV26_101219 [Parapedobacter indicus]SFH78525.1 hypothetical protein SAMN05444682_101206 [Parapedobacter indicus]